jgi:hypothetical protein
MRFCVAAALAAMLMTAALGCQERQRTAATPTAALPTVAETPEPVFDARPNTWAKGQVFRVWHFKQGELMALVGWRDGLEKGDILILQRDGTQVNTIEALEVHQDTFYGRVLDRSDEALLPRVGDMAVRGPQPKRMEPPVELPMKKEGPKASEPE